MFLFMDKDDQPYFVHMVQKVYNRPFSFFEIRNTVCQLGVCDLSQ
jgi:hypothetical protein